MLKLIGSRIKEARLSKGISQKRLALALGLSDKAVSSYESSRTYPPLDTLYKIASELGQDISYFISNDSINSEIISKVNSISTNLDRITTDLEELKKKLN